MSSKLEPDSSSHISDNSRDSYFRRITKQPVESFVDWLHSKYPKLTANQLSMLVVIGSGLGSILALKSQNPDSGVSKSAAAATLLGADMIDGLDGPLARLMVAENPDSHDSKKGALLDVSSDRIGELMKAIVRMIVAHERHNNVGEILALISGITNTLPSLAKAFIKFTKGLEVAEAGKGLPGLAGTRAVRAAINDGSTVYPQIGPIAVQPIADTLEIISNLATAKGRLDVFKSDSQVSLSEDERKAAATKFNLLIGITAISTISLISTYLHNHKTQH